MIKTVFFFRKPISGYHSIEELFQTIMGNLPGDILPVVKKMPFVSSGMFGRIVNLCMAPFYQGDINHITGDIHYVALFLRKQKTILTIHDLEIINRSHALKRMLILFFWFRLPARRVAYITVISEFTKREFLRYVTITPDKIKVIPNCIPGVIPFQPKPFHDQCPILLQVGTRHNKNIPNVLKALEDIKCKLVILGNPDSGQVQLLKKHRIMYESYSQLSYDKVLELYSQADMLVFASTYEGFGLPILESQAMGRPVVTSNISSMPEVAGDGACLVDPYDVSSIREGILKVMNDAAYRDDLVSKGRANAEMFKPRIIAERYADLYRQVYDEYNKI